MGLSGDDDVDSRDESVLMLMPFSNDGAHEDDDDDLDDEERDEEDVEEDDRQDGMLFLFLSSC